MGTLAETANVYYRLPTKENKLPFSFCRKQMEVISVSKRMCSSILKETSYF
jgi:hypothetical protein